MNKEFEKAQKFISLYNYRLKLEEYLGKLSEAKEFPKFLTVISGKDIQLTKHATSGGIEIETEKIIKLIIAGLEAELQNNSKQVNNFTIKEND